jgi:hypothetical protein
VSGTPLMTNRGAQCEIAASTRESFAAFFSTTLDMSLLLSETRKSPDAGFRRNDG